MRSIRIRLAAALYELALQVAPSDVSDDVLTIVADGSDIFHARLELGRLDLPSWPEALRDTEV